MRQCTLKREGKQTVAWLDDAKIKVGSVISLKGETDLWNITEMSAIGLPNDYVNERSQDYKKTRQASDI